MLFSSATFIYLFLPVTLFFYFVVFRKNRLWQNVFLLIMSLGFYAWGEPKFVVVMVASIVLNWYFGLLISKKRERIFLCKLLVALSVTVNLGLLFVFKYLNFTAEIIEDIIHREVNIPHIALPIGISFFTFQAMSYVIDVYRQKGQAQTNLLNVGLYISFFPQLIAGPIVRYETVADEIKNRKETVDDFFDGFARFVVGLSKKVLLANSFAILADQAFNMINEGYTISVAFSWLGAIAYALQIFFDFGGYSDMAIGLGRMFGFHFLENFNYPYVSMSISEFWRRWHISLGTWFKDYLYIPLGGNRVSKARNVFNLFVVWLLTGMWHGANFTFLAWGLMYFVLLMFEKLSNFEKRRTKGLQWVKWCYTMFFVLLGWVLFRSESISVAVGYMKSMFGLVENSLIDGLFTGWFRQNVILIVVGCVLSTPLFRFAAEKTKACAVVDIVKTVGLICLFLLSLASLVSNSYNPFIYFNF